MRGARCGFTVLELVVALAVAALLAGVLLPQVIGRLNQAQTASAVQTLANLHEALLSFRADVGRYPVRLSYLSATPGGTPRDLCRRTIPDLSDWRGPYVGRAIPLTGLVVGTATVRDSLERSPASESPGNPVGTLFIRVDGVERTVADEAEAAYDANGNLSAGTIRWAESGGSGVGTLTYAVPVRGC